MTILEFLKKYDARISYDDRWLVADLDGECTVYERKYCAKKTKMLFSTSSEEIAVRVLKDGIGI